MGIIYDANTGKVTDTASQQWLDPGDPRAIAAKEFWADPRIAGTMPAPPAPTSPLQEAAKTLAKIGDILNPSKALNPLWSWANNANDPAKKYLDSIANPDPSRGWASTDPQEGGKPLNPLILMLLMGGSRGGMSNMLPFLLMSGSGGLTGLTAPLAFMLGSGGRGGSMGMLPFLIPSFLGGMEPMTAMLMGQSMNRSNTSGYRRQRRYYGGYRRRFR